MTLSYLASLLLWACHRWCNRRSRRGDGWRWRLGAVVIGQTVVPAWILRRPGARTHVIPLTPAAGGIPWPSIN